MPKIEFKPTELETIDNFKEIMHYDELEEILTNRELLFGKFKRLNIYFSHVEELIEFKPIFSIKENIFKFTHDKWIMTRKTLAKEIEKLKSQYKEYDIDNIANENFHLFSFLMTDTNFLKTHPTKKEREPNITETVFLNFDNCNKNIPNLNSYPKFETNEYDVTSNIIDTIFNYSFKSDKTNEWAKVACEYLLRNELDIQQEKVEKQLKKLTEFRRHGVDSDNAVKLIVYNDMIEKKITGKDEEYWRVYLPKNSETDKAWFNVKINSITEVSSDENMIELFLVKNDKSNIHYLKDGEHKVKVVSNNEDIIPQLEKISNEYLKWKEDNSHPTFAKKLVALSLGQNNEDFVIAINGGEHYISIHFKENEIQGSLYDGNFYHNDHHIIAIKETTDTLETIDTIFNRLSPTKAKTSTLAKCDQEIFFAKVTENKKISDYKLIAAINEMSANDDKRSDLAKAMAKKTS